MSYGAFNTHTDEYDAWFDSEPGRTIFAMEVECLRPLLHSYPRPYLEAGAGSGRFAQALGVEYGVEPSEALGRKAISRGIQVVNVTGEKLPFPVATFGGVLIALTLCFVNDPLRVLQEVSRVLRPQGGLVLGLILKGSSWAEFYRSKGERGHPLYRQARFFSRDEVEDLLRSSRFEVLEYRSVLFQPPGQTAYHPECPAYGFYETAGFTAIRSHKR